MHDKKTVHIISHTHWDREWYLNSKYTNEWLPIFFDSLFTMLEKEKKYRFILDGQTLILEDYFSELQSQGKDVQEYKQKIKAYVGEGRLFVGPYYMQTDWQLVSDEALIRNLLIGKKMAEEFGHVMKAGWMLDNFGQISQAVQINKRFGIKGIFVWRGVDMDPQDVKSEFLWESPDGSKLPTAYLLSSYRNAMRLAEFKDILKERVYGEVEKLSYFNSTPNALLMNGYDQELYPDDVLPYIEEGKLDSDGMKVIQSTPEEYIEAIEKHKDNFRKLKGYLYSGRFISVFPGVLSSRMYLKLHNEECQRTLSRYSEPLSAIAWSLGGRYHGDKIEASWRELLKNHPHDSICGVSIDAVHEDMEERFENSLIISKQVIKEALGEIISTIDTSKVVTDEIYTLFNTLPYPRGGVIRIKTNQEGLKIGDSHGKLFPYQTLGDGFVDIYLDKVKGLGYKTIYILPGERKQEEFQEQVFVQGNTMENNHLKVTVNSDGTVDVYHKDTQKEYRGIGELQDGGDAGDEYNYSYPKEDKIISSRNHSAAIEFVDKGPIKARVRIETVLELPEGLNDDRTGRSGTTRFLPIVTWISLEAGSEILKFNTKLKNTVKDHRLRLVFPTGIKTNVSYAQTQFDVVEHEITPEPYDNSAVPEHVARIIIGAREPHPITIFPHRFFVDINDGSVGLCLVDRGLPEYEILPEGNAIALTLFRSVGWIAKDDLLTRIGDAGPTIATPDAQCLRDMNFEYALYPHRGNWLEGNCHRIAEDFNNELIAVRTENHEGDMVDSSSFLEVLDDKDTFATYAIKISEDGKGLIVRLCNLDEEPGKCKIAFNLDVEEVYYTDLKEEVTSKIEEVKENTIEIEAGPKEIVTLKVLISRKDMVIKEGAPSQDIISHPYNLADFAKYESVPLVTLEEIEGEEKRAGELEEKLKASKTSLEHETYKRAALEARLSAILIKRKYLKDYRKDSQEYEDYISRIDKEIRRIGLELNKTRVSKRVYEYIES